MAVKTPITGVFSGSDLTGLAELQSGDFIGVANGGTGAVTFSEGLLKANGTNAFTTVADSITIGDESSNEFDVSLGTSLSFVGGTNIDTALTGGIMTVSVPKELTGPTAGKTLTDTTNTGNITLDFNTYQNFVLTFTGDVTFVNPSTESVGQSGIIVIIQDGTGSRTLGLGTDYETVGGSGITLSTAASAVDILPYFVKASGSIQLGAPQLAFS